MYLFLAHSQMKPWLKPLFVVLGFDCETGYDLPCTSFHETRGAHLWLRGAVQDQVFRWCR